MFHPHTRTQHHKTHHIYTYDSTRWMCALFRIPREPKIKLLRAARIIVYIMRCEWKFPERESAEILTPILSGWSWKMMNFAPEWVVAPLSLLGATLPQSVYKTLFGANDFPPPSYPHTRFHPTAGNLITPLNFRADYSAFLQLLLTKTFHFSKGRRSPPSCTHTQKFHLSNLLF